MLETETNHSGLVSLVYQVSKMLVSLVTFIKNFDFENKLLKLNMNHCIHKTIF